MKCGFEHVIKSIFAKVNNFVALHLCGIVTLNYFCLKLKKMRILFALVFVFQFYFGFGQEKFDAVAVDQFQKELNSEFVDAKTSPLTAEDLATFKTLAFYPANESFFVTAKFIRTKKEKPFEMKTSTDRKPLYVKYGEAHFQIDGRDFKLNIYKNIALSKKKEYKDNLFLPFSDLTSGKESYIGGRYIDLKIPKGDTIAIDFNTSYNPYCAYNPKYSCPKVPLENDLDIEIKAGVKKFHD
jgi:uncharacterized protein (DUF1684 family)